MLLKYLWRGDGGAGHVLRLTMARRPFLTSFSWLAGESSFAGSNGYQSRKPDCTDHKHVMRWEGMGMYPAASLQVVIRLQRNTWDGSTVQDTCRRVLHSKSSEPITAHNARCIYNLQAWQSADTKANELLLLTY